MRFRITVRGESSELRGFIDVLDYDALVAFSEAMRPYGLVLASPAEDGVQFTTGFNWPNGG